MSVVCECIKCGDDLTLVNKVEIHFIVTINSPWILYIYIYIYMKGYLSVILLCYSSSK